MKALRINAVLYKDMQLKVKKSKTSVLIFVFNLILSLIAFGVLITLSTMAGSYQAVDSRALIYLFIGLVCAEYGMICLMIPSFTAGAISSEREKQTLDVLLTTRMTPWEIIKGKYWSSIMQILLLFVSGLPIFALVFIYGGISFFQVIEIMLVLVASLMFIASVGIYFSAAMKKTLGATVMTYFILGFLALGTVIIVALVYALIEYLNNYYYYSNMSYTSTAYNDWSMGPLVFILYLNPVATIFDSLSKVFGIVLDYGQADGMAYFAKHLADYGTGNPFVRYWTAFSIAVQTACAYLNLRLAARALNPLREKVKKCRKRKKTE